MRQPTVASLLICLSGSVLSAQECLWTKQAAPGPGDRRWASMAYDSARARIVLFGGVNAANTAYLGDTWEFDGATWTQRATTGPSPRAAAAMAFDSSRNRTVLFSGDSSLNQYPPPQTTDTWEWDGSTWTFRGNAPSAPARSVMAFDAARGRTVAFTYYHAGNFATREWDGSTWSTIAIPAPHAPAGQTMVYDSIRQRIVLIGRPFGSTSVWEYDGAAWTQRSVVGPTPPFAQYQNAAATFDPKRGRVIMVGGEVSWEDYSPETWEWNPQSSTWSKRANGLPGARPGPTLVWHSAIGRAVLMGRQLIHTGGETWLYNPAGTGEFLISQAPVPRIVNLYEPVSFTVVAPGATAFQWYKVPNALSDGGDISGSNTATLSISRCGISDIGTYMVAVTGPCGPAFAKATLGLNPAGCYPNCDGSTAAPVITAGDFQCFINQFAGRSAYANCDGSTAEPVHTANDFQCFINKYAGGCE